FFFKKESVIKLDRVQYLERKTGPLLNRFGLCKNYIVTAGHEIILPLVNEDTTKEMEEYCMDYLEKVDADV
ncbi:PH domain-containing protein, partial [Staphylococcus condimenti]